VTQRRWFKGEIIRTESQFLRVKSGNFIKLTRARARSCPSSSSQRL
jgi:hypothetical protein